MFKARSIRPANRRSAFQAAAAVAVLSLMMPGVMRMPVSVVRHMMPMGMVRLVVSVMDGGRGRGGEHQRGRDDDRQSRDDFTH